jgi:hypothetical protein
MEAKDYMSWYEQLGNQLSDLSDERTELEVRLADINKQIEHIQNTMHGLGPLTGMISPVDDFTDLGITDAVRSVLDCTNRMSATDVRTKMQARGYDLSKYSAPDATVRTILKRLIEAGKAQAEKEGHKVFYKYLPTDDEIPF